MCHHKALALDGNVYLGHSLSVLAAQGDREIHHWIWGCAWVLMGYPLVT